MSVKNINSVKTMERKLPRFHINENIAMPGN
jgi:hypothetical protein